MPPRITSNRHDFSKLQEYIQPFQARGRTDSAALLIWFLQTIYRLDDVDAVDAVCDNQSDKGIDALTCSIPDREIVLIQAKKKDNLPATLGDKDLKEFVGSIQQFSSPESVRKLMASTTNQELKRLLASLDIAQRIEDGFAIRPLFVTNIAANQDATDYLQLAADAGHSIDLWDLERLGPVLGQLAKEWFVEGPISLRMAEGKVFHSGTKSSPSLVFAAVPATELVKLPGIEDTRVFAQNVRLGLGRTRVNTDILTSVGDKVEHPKFLAFHNGLTIVAKGLSLRGRSLRLENFSVCNGCQSLLAFYRQKRFLTPSLEVLVRVVRVTDDRGLAASIAYRTNNQNPISLRDLSANDVTQLQLKAEFDATYGKFATYGIKRGDVSGRLELSNEIAGQMLMSVYLKQPWSAHQKYKVFDELEGEIFRYGMSASHIRLAQLITVEAEKAVQKLSNERLRKYGLTKFLVAYLVGATLRKEADGKRLLDSPAAYLETSDGTGKGFQEKVLKGVKDIVGDVITELEYYFDQNGGENYDYKSEFKSQKAVMRISSELLKSYEKDKSRKKIKPFKLPK